MIKLWESNFCLWVYGLLFCELKKLRKLNNINPTYFILLIDIWILLFIALRYSSIILNIYNVGPGKNTEHPQHAQNILLVHFHRIH